MMNTPPNFPAVSKPAPLLWALAAVLSAMTAAVNAASVLDSPPGSVSAQQPVCSSDCATDLFGAFSRVLTDSPQPTTAPSDDKSTPEAAPDNAGWKRGNGLGGGGGGAGGARGEGRENMNPGGKGDPARPKYERPTEEELTKIRAFMQVNMPKSYEALTTGQTSRPMRLQIIGTSQYRRLERIKQDHPDRKDLQDAVLDDCHSWDELGALFREWPTAEAERREEIKKLARPFAMKIYENNLVERKVRLEALRQSVAKEEEKLSKDEANKDEMVNKRVDGMIQEVMLPHNGGNRMNGRRPPAASNGAEPAPDGSKEPSAQPGPTTQPG